MRRKTQPRSLSGRLASAGVATNPPRPTGDDPVRVTVINQFPQQLVDVLREIPGVEVRFDPHLLAPQRFPSDPDGEPGFVRTPAQQRRLQEMIADAEVVIGLPDATVGGIAGLVRMAPALRWVQGMPAGAGEAVGKAGLTDDELRRVAFTSGAGVYSTALAEWAMFGILAFVKDLPFLLANREQRAWGHRPSRELRGGLLAIIGLGDIGRETAALAAAFGMRVVGARRHPDRHPVPAGVQRVIAPEDLAQVLPDADAVVLALPSTPATDGMLSRELIDALRPDAVVVNVGRGNAIDEPALIAALREGRLAGAALDVASVEPLPPDHPLWSLPNVLLSTHTAAASPAQDRRRIELAADNLRRYLAGEPLRNLVDPARFY